MQKNAESFIINWKQYCILLLENKKEVCLK